MFVHGAKEATVTVRQSLYVVISRKRCMIEP